MAWELSWRRQSFMFGPLLDAEHALPHHHNVGELHEQVKQDHWRGPAVVQAYACEQTRLPPIKWGESPVPCEVPFCIPPQHPVVGVQNLHHWPLFAVGTHRYAVP